MPEGLSRANVQTWFEQCCVEDVSEGAKMGAKLGGVVTRERFGRPSQLRQSSATRLGCIPPVVESDAHGPCVCALLILMALLPSAVRVCGVRPQEQDVCRLDPVVSTRAALCDALYRVS